MTVLPPVIRDSSSDRVRAACADFFSSMSSDSGIVFSPTISVSMVAGSGLVATDVDEADV